MHLSHLTFVLFVFLVKTTVHYNETETSIKITEIEEIINKTVITTHQVAPTTHEVSPTTHEVSPTTHEVAPTTHEVSPTTHEVAPTTHEVAPTTHEVAPTGKTARNYSKSECLLSSFLMVFSLSMFFFFFTITATILTDMGFLGLMPKQILGHKEIPIPII